mgnify:FL=1
MKNPFRIIAFALFLALTLTMFSCGGGNSLFAGVDPENGIFTLTVSDGTTRKLFRLQNDTSTKNNLISALSKVTAKPFSGTPHDVPTPAADSPAYVLSAYTKDGSDFSALYSGGYLVTDDGSVYAFDFDFASVPEKYSFTEDRTLNSAATGFESLLARDGDSFDASRLVTHEDYMSDYGLNYPAAPDGVTASFVSLGDNNGKPAITVEISNGTASEFSFGKYYIIEVSIDGRWYVLPELPDRPVMVEDIGIGLAAGKSTEMTYSLWNWGDLPAGTYRVTISDNLSAEFTIN